MARKRRLGIQRPSADRRSEHNSIFVTSVEATMHKKELRPACSDDRAGALTPTSLRGERKFHFHLFLFLFPSPATCLFCALPAFELPHAVSIGLMTTFQPSLQDLPRKTDPAHGSPRHHRIRRTYGWREQAPLSPISAIRLLLSLLPSATKVLKVAVRSQCTVSVIARFPARRMTWQEYYNWLQDTRTLSSLRMLNTRR